MTSPAWRRGMTNDESIDLQPFNLFNLPTMFKGTYTALVTPFNKDGSVDYGALRALVDAQAAAGVAGVCPVGTTGESPTLSYEEHEDVIRRTIEYNAGRMQVIAGTGANCTREAVELTQHALADGADATLQIAPYYNKPSPEGLYRHFMEVADVGVAFIAILNAMRCLRVEEFRK